MQWQPKSVPNLTLLSLRTLSSTLWTRARNDVPRPVRRQPEALRPLAHSHIAGGRTALAASELPSRLCDPTPHTFVETALLTLSKCVVVATAGSAWRELDSRSGLAFGPSPSGLHRTRSKRETQLPSKGGHPSAWGTPRLAPHSGLGHKTAFPRQFGA